MSWRIYYADGSVAEGSGEPVAIRCDGVLAILHGKEIEQGFDYYLWRSDFAAWVGTKESSVIRQFQLHAGKIKACLAGDNVPNEVFQAVMRRVVEDQARD